MRIPGFWTRQKVTQTVNGRPMEIACTGWSYQDAADAAKKALERAEGVFRALREGRADKEYLLYLDRPIKEEIVGEYSADGVAILVTRTGYGSLVLNTDSVMFIDIDEPEEKSAGLLELFKGLFGGKKAGDSKAEWIATVQEEVRRLCTERGLSMRLYRTHKGLRGLITDRLFKATDPAALALLREFQSDELYVRLCKSQDCFRARLTPKPFRCSFKAPAQSFPFETPAHEERQRKWEARYAEAIKPYATCAFLGGFGSGQVLPAVGKVVQLHDAMTRTSDKLPLA